MQLGGLIIGQRIADRRELAGKPSSQPQTYTVHRQVQDGARYPEKSRGLLREGVDVKFGFMAKHRGIRPVALMCGALDVSRSDLGLILC